MIELDLTTKAEVLEYTPKAGDRLIIKFPLHTSESQMKRFAERFQRILEGVDVKAVFMRGEVEIQVLRESDLA